MDETRESMDEIRESMNETREIWIQKVRNILRGQKLIEKVKNNSQKNITQEIYKKFLMRLAHHFTSIKNIDSKV